MTIERTNMERRYIRLDMPELKRNFIFFDPEKISKVKLGCYNVRQKPTSKNSPEYYDCIEMKIDGEKERFLFANKVNDDGRYLEEKEAEKVLQRVMEVIENIVEFRDTNSQGHLDMWPGWSESDSVGITGSDVVVTWGNSSGDINLREKIKESNWEEETNNDK